MILWVLGCTLKSPLVKWFGLKQVLGRYDILEKTIDPYIKILDGWVYLLGSSRLRNFKLDNRLMWIAIDVAFTYNNSFK
jgi:hypothetical protein